MSKDARKDWFQPMQPASPEREWPLGDQAGYAIALCVCKDGAYLGARQMGTPCVCERCGRITLDQWEFITAALDAVKAEAGRAALREAAEGLDRVGALLMPGAKPGMGVFHKGFVLDWLRARADQIGGA